MQSQKMAQAKIVFNPSLLTPKAKREYKIPIDPFKNNGDNLNKSTRWGFSPIA